MDITSKNPKVLQILKSINKINDTYVVRKEEDIKEFSTAQSPVATLVMCCDSRAHTTAFTYNPENNFFIVRNIGNQYILNQGCVEFGVRVLKTPVLIFLGHTQCGAIKASLGDYSHLPSSIIREVDHLALSIKSQEEGSCDKSFTDGVINNINKQVELAVKDFQDLVSADELVVIGMVLDIDNSLQDGYGRINVLNVNGTTNLDALSKNPLVADFFAPHFIPAT